VKQARIIYLAVLIAALGGAGVVAWNTWYRDVPGDAEGNGGDLPAGPEIVLRKVEITEIRKGEAPNRLVSDQATYRILNESVSGTGVTITLQGKRGELILRAPEARWDMRSGGIFLPNGGSAENEAGWSAHVNSARLSLPERTLTASGEAKLKGPGLAMAGDNLVWRWQEGKVELDRPKTRVMPARVLGGNG
jgi:hypothetical protein